MSRKAATLMVALMVSTLTAGCLDAGKEPLSIEVSYESTNATIVERWVDGELVDAEYPVLTFDFTRSVTSGAFIQFSVIGEHAAGSSPASESTVVDVEFRKHGLQELTFVADVTGANPSEMDEILPTATVRIEKRIEWSESATNNPLPMPIDTRNEAGTEPASALVIESTVFNPDLIANIGGGRDVEVFWELIDSTQVACQSQPGTVNEGDSATWNTLDFDTSDAHELRVNYEEGQDAVEIEQVAFIQYEHSETLPVV